MPTPTACQPLIERRERLRDCRVVTAGGANIEHSFPVPDDFQPDAKVSIAPQPRVAGGSAVNHACRLLAMGVGVHPILPLAKSDPMSAVIVEALEQAELCGGSKYRRTDLEIRGSQLTTPFTTILRREAARAVLNEFSPELMRRFREHVELHLERLTRKRRPVDVVMVGHVHADRAKPARGEVGFAGAITERILTARERGDARSFVNFGSAQYKLGSARWDALLRDRVDVFQLDIGEVRRFCADAKLPDLSLESILAWFRSRCTVVVTLERFGAIGQLVDSDSPVAAWPYLLENVVDSTGAGDAMGAGIVASMLAQPFDEATDPADVRQAKFGSALAFGRVCGAFACTTVGGANACPDIDALAAFERKGKRHERGALTRNVTAHDLFLIDRAFDH